MIICEIGLNHMGDLEEAKNLTSKLLESDIDAITFQIREDDFYTKGKNSKLLLPKIFYEEIIKTIQNSGLKVGIALAEETQIEFFENQNVDFYKILSKDIENYSLIKKIKETEKPTYVSTGMSDFPQIERLVNFILDKRENFFLIHTQLSHNIEDVNLNLIPILKQKFQLPVAYGHHSLNHHVIFLSLVSQPSAIFFYVKSNHFKKYPDDEHAINIDKIDFILKNLDELSKSLKNQNKVQIENKINKNFEI